MDAEGVRNMPRVLIEGRSRPFDKAVMGMAFDLRGSEGLDRASVKYADRPHGVQRCAECTHVLAAAQGVRCSIVEGQVGLNGWCALWTPGD